MLERLQKIEDEKMSESTWRDVCETWMALLQLRAKIEVERGQSVLDCMLADPKLVAGLGAGIAMLNMQGTVPSDLLTELNQGPGVHIRQNAFRYHKALDRELMRIRRVREIKQNLVTLVGSSFVAVLVGVANFLSRLAYNAVVAGDLDD